MTAYAWKRRGETVFEARLTESVQGAYKGYPIGGHESPAWLP